MTARVLVVDDLPANVKLLEAKLAAEYYDVVTASNGKQAIQKAREHKPDIILLDVMMPEMDGFETCQVLKNDLELQYIPVVMVTALSDIEDRVRGLRAGADDFLTKPVNDNALFARIRSLTRLKIMMDELRLRNQTGEEFGLSSMVVSKDENDIDHGIILLVNDDVVEGRNQQQLLRRDTNMVDLLEDPDQTLEIARQKDYDLIIISTQLVDADGLRICSQLRSQRETRTTPILILIEDEDTTTMVRGLDMGVNDYLTTPVEEHELIARVNTQISRKRYQDALKNSYKQNLSMAVKDALTGLCNRRYFDTHYGNMIALAKEQQKSLTVMMIDVDHFKSVNDTFGHQEGDEVLKGVAQRVEASVRSSDLCARYGGEEFVVVTNASPESVSLGIAERICKTVRETPIHTVVGDQAHDRDITISVGVSSLVEGDSGEKLLQRADEALYIAKESGRNRVVAKFVDGRMETKAVFGTENVAISNPLADVVPHQEAVTAEPILEQGEEHSASDFQTMDPIEAIEPLSEQMDAVDESLNSDMPSISDMQALPEIAIPDVQAEAALQSEYQPEPVPEEIASPYMTMYEEPVQQPQSEQSPTDIASSAGGGLQEALELFAKNVHDAAISSHLSEEKDFEETHWVEEAGIADPAPKDSSVLVEQITEPEPVSEPEPEPVPEIEDANENSDQANEMAAPAAGEADYHSEHIHHEFTVSSPYYGAASAKPSNAEQAQKAAISPPTTAAPAAPAASTPVAKQEPPQELDNTTSTESASDADNAGSAGSADDTGSSDNPFPKPPVYRSPE